MEMSKEYEEDQNIENMKLNDDQKMSNEQLDEVTVTPSVGISSKVARRVTFYGAGGNNNTEMNGTIDGAKDVVAKCVIEGDKSEMKDDTLLETGEKHDVGQYDDNMGDVGLSGGVHGDQPEGIVCQFKRGVCLLHKIKGDKQTIRSKRWGKVKGGYGWIHSSKVKYSCKAGLKDLKLASLENGWSESRSPGLTANSQGIIAKGLPDDISEQRGRE